MLILETANKMVPREFKCARFISRTLVVETGLKANAEKIPQIRDQKFG